MNLQPEPDGEPAHHYLYHIRDEAISGGFGHDGYVGITDNFERRHRQHMSALKRGCHPNREMQAAHDASENGLQMRILNYGPREKIRAHERLVVDRPNKHWNRQQGGGPDRAMSTDEAIRRAWGSKGKTDADATSHKAEDQASAARGDASGAGDHPDSDQNSARSAGTGHGASANQGARAREKGEAHKGGTKTQSDKAGASVGPGVAAAAAEALPAFCVGGAALAGGLLGATLMNKTVLKDDPTLSSDERSSRKAGRVGSYVGGVTGAGGALAAVSAAGTVSGLSSAGVAAGLTSIGLGSASLGCVVIVAGPALLAAGAGYGIYRAVRALA